MKKVFYFLGIAFIMAACGSTANYVQIDSQKDQDSEARKLRQWQQPLSDR